MIVSIRNMCDIFFVTDNRVHLCKNRRKIILAGRVKSKFFDTVLALLIYINRQNILPVTDEQGICGGGQTVASAVTGISQFILLFIFLLYFIHNRGEIIGKTELIIFLQAVQIKILARMKIRYIINRCTATATALSTSETSPTPPNSCMRRCSQQN